MCSWPASVPHLLRGIHSGADLEVRGKDGEFRGGPAYYIEQALGKRGLGVLFAVLLILCYAYGFNGLQAYNMTSALQYYFSESDAQMAAMGIGIHHAAFFAFVILAVRR